MEKCLEQALRDLYDKKVDPRREPDPALYGGFLRTYNHAVKQSVYKEEQRTLARQFKNNNEVFSAFRAHRMSRDMAAQMIDKEGNLKSFDQFRKDVEPIADHHVRQWLRTEYDMALSRAHLASEWETYEADRDIMPNLRWVESTAVTPDAVHSSFWGMVRPVDDAFWAAHHPGDHWGCQCSLEQTDDPVTPISDEVIRKAPPPSPGLEENPGKTKRIFSYNSPYFPGSCETCPFRHLLKEPRTEKDCYNCPAAVEASSRTYANNVEVLYEYNGHTLTRHVDVETDKHDYQNVVDVCKTFVRQGKSCIMTPKLNGVEKNPNYPAIYGDLIGTEFEKSCPDIRIGEHWYEHEGYDVLREGQNKDKFSSLLSRGLKQSNRVILEDCKVTDHWAIEKCIRPHLLRGRDIEEVWIHSGKGRLRLLWKRQGGDHQ